MNVFIFLVAVAQKYTRQELYTVFNTIDVSKEKLDLPFSYKTIKSGNTLNDCITLVFPKIFRNLTQCPKEVK